MRLEQRLTDKHTWQMEVRAEQGELAHACSLHLSNAPFSTSNFSDGKKYTSKPNRCKAAHLTEVLLSFWCLAARPFATSMTWLLLHKGEGSQKRCTCSCPLFAIPTKTKSPVMWQTAPRDGSAYSRAGGGCSSSSNAGKVFQTPLWLDRVLSLRRTKRLHTPENTVLLTAAARHPATVCVRKKPARCEQPRPDTAPWPARLVASRLATLHSVRRSFLLVFREICVTVKADAG